MQEIPKDSSRTGKFIEIKNNTKCKGISYGYTFKIPLINNYYKSIM